MELFPVECTLKVRGTSLNRKPTCGRKNLLFRVPYYGFYIKFLKKVGLGVPKVTLNPEPWQPRRKASFLGPDDNHAANAFTLRNFTLQEGSLVGLGFRI